MHIILFSILPKNHQRSFFVHFSLQFDQLKQNFILLFFFENALVAFTTIHH